VNLQTYRESDAEQTRTADLLRLLPRGRSSILDIGAREGDYFETVTALDLARFRASSQECSRWPAM
jgi:hypothetical protein